MTDFAIKALHAAGTAAGAYLGLHYIGGDISPFSGMLSGAGTAGGAAAGFSAGTLVGHAITSASAKSAQNPLLYTPFAWSRIARVSGEVAAANVGGAAAAQIPPQTQQR